MLDDQIVEPETSWVAVWLSLDHYAAPLHSMALQELLEGAETILVSGLDRETSVND